MAMIVNRQPALHQPVVNICRKLYQENAAQHVKEVRLNIYFSIEMGMYSEYFLNAV